MIKKIVVLSIAFVLLKSVSAFSQLPGFPGDPGGTAVPLDGGLLLALLALGGGAAVLFKKKK